MDTSVVVKWFTQEKRTEEAVSILTGYNEGKINIIIPSILAIELANSLFFGLGYRLQKLDDALKGFFDLNIPNIIINDKIIRGASRMMEKFTIAIYDAIFLFLAEEKQIPLITADIKHHQKKYSKYITYLEEITF